MASKAPKIRPSDLPTKKMRAPDGTLYSMKVVQSDSLTFGLDLQAAFRWNVSRIRAEQRKRVRVENNAA